MRKTGRNRLALEGEIRGRLEDELYLHADKLIALCVAQSALDSNDCLLPLGIRSHYSLLMEEQARALRHMLDTLFEPTGAETQS
jgi:hypothetical protein